MDIFGKFGFHFSASNNSQRHLAKADNQHQNRYYQYGKAVYPYHCSSFVIPASPNMTRFPQGPILSGPYHKPSFHGCHNTYPGGYHNGYYPRTGYWHAQNFNDERFPDLQYSSPEQAVVPNWTSHEYHERYGHITMDRRFGIVDLRRSYQDNEPYEKQSETFKRSMTAPLQSLQVPFPQYHRKADTCSQEEQVSPSADIKDYTPCGSLDDSAMGNEPQIVIEDIKIEEEPKSCAESM